MFSKNAITFYLACASILLLSLSQVSTKDISSIEHIVIFMQENRAFDHYYGSLKGVRGFNDHAAPPLPSGLPPFFQPVSHCPLLDWFEKAKNPYMLPFHLAFNETSATCMPAPTMNYQTDVKIWNKGWMDSWNTAREAGFGMSYFKRSDLEYYYALADAFTVGDQYFQSTFTETDPNRLHQFSGSNGLYQLNNDIPTEGLEWETLAETLEKNNITWKVYQEVDNFDDNGFAWFKSFRNAQPGSPLYEKGMRRVANNSLVQEFYNDVNNRTLPQVSILIAPTWLSEHAENHPQDGEDLTARLIAVLSAPENQEVYTKTVFILNYDEGGQFYDHHWTPTPPGTESDGISTVSTEGEILQKPHFYWVGWVPPGTPIGLGFRVPLMLISPWTRGPYTFSEVADHTSVIKLIEKRFGIKCPNITPWRRAVTSDLLAAFDFENPDYSWPQFPSTRNNTNQSRAQCSGLPYPTIPEQQSFPEQEQGVRKTRPTRYQFNVEDRFNESTGLLDLLIENTGELGAAFLLVNSADTSRNPRRYTVEAGKQIKDQLRVLSSGYNYSLHGPNGFVRKLEGNNHHSLADFNLLERLDNENIEIAVKSLNPNCSFVIKQDLVDKELEITIDNSRASHVLEVKENGDWYDITVLETCKGNSTHNSEIWSKRRFMGHLEVQKETTTDPAMGLRKNFKVQPSSSA